MEEDVLNVLMHFYLKRKGYQDWNRSAGADESGGYRIKGGKEVRKEGAHRYILESQREMDRYGKRRQELKAALNWSRKRWRDRAMEG